MRASQGVHTYHVPLIPLKIHFLSLFLLVNTIILYFFSKFPLVVEPFVFPNINPKLTLIPLK